MATDDGIGRFSVRIEPTNYDWLRRKSFDERISMNEILNNLCEKERVKEEITNGKG